MALPAAEACGDHLASPNSMEGAASNAGRDSETLDSQNPPNPPGESTLQEPARREHLLLASHLSSVLSSFFGP